MNRSALRLIVAAVAAFCLWPAHAVMMRGKLGAISQGNPLGINVSALGYAYGSQPFLNILKNANNESGAITNATTGWYTASNSVYDTNEEAYLQLDSDGYATSLTASPIPSGGQGFTFIKSNVLLSQATPPGATYPYAPGLYRLKFEGQGTLVVKGDATTGGGATCSGWASLVTNAERDARMGTAYSIFLGDWKTTVGSGASNLINLYNLITPINSGGAWGLEESVMQTITPLSSAPAKYQAAANYAQ